MADLGAIGTLSTLDSFPAYAGVIAGTVLDANGAPACRLVRAHRRDSGAVSNEDFSDPVTGAYAIFLNYQANSVPHYVVEFDDAAGVDYNARIFDRV